jgi:ABC-type glycerol-3-phosphate transport system substrate-binding protein
MLVDGCWMMGTYQKALPKLGMAMIPKGPKGRANAYWVQAGMAITKGSKNPDLTWEYLNWLNTSEEANKMVAASGQSCGAPANRNFDAAYATAYTSIPGGIACAKCLDEARDYTIMHSRWSEMWDTIINPEWEKVVNGKIDAKEFSAAINDKVNAIAK